ncbi:hypothetical protein ABXS75_01940 [Roseburia hominis]
MSKNRKAPDKNRKASGNNRDALQRIRKILKGRTGTFLLLGLAVACLLGSGIGSTRAALQIYSEYYEARVGMYDIGITLMENGKEIAVRDYANQMAQGEESTGWTTKEGALLENMLKESDGRLVPERKYKEELSVVNSGSIPEYVRVRIYRYWVDPEAGKDEDGNEVKVTTMDPKWIKLELDESGWWRNEAECTDECTVLYYRSELPTGGAAAFCKSITIDDAVAKVTKTEVGNGVVKTTYDYEGRKFVLEVDADAVQNHNAKDAIRSAWGVDPGYID